MTGGGAPADRIVALYRRPHNRGVIEPASGVAEINNPLCGDRLRLTIAVRDGHVVDARFTGDACAVSTASASLLTDAVRGVSLDELASWDGERAIALLDVTLPTGRRRCATLPLDGLQAAAEVVAARRGLQPVVLAAGQASRFGGDKVVADFRGEPMVRHAVRAMMILGLDVLVVAGTNADAVRAAVDGLPASVVAHPEAREGLASSLAAATRFAGDAKADAMLVALADQPTLDASVVTRVADRWVTDRAPAVSARYAGERGHPVVLGRELFPALLANRGDAGARDILAALGERVQYVDVDEAAPADVDTAADLARLAESAGYVGTIDPHEDGRAAGN